MSGLGAVVNCRFKPTQRPLSRRQHAYLSETQDRMTLRIMLGNGGQVTIQGDLALVAMPTGGARYFPAQMVREVQDDA